MPDEPAVAKADTDAPMGFLSRLTDIDPDEVSPVRRGANRRRLLLMKADETAEVDDMLSVPVEYEGALTDMLRKEGTEEPVIEATVAGLRLLKAASEDLPESVREIVEKLGTQMYPIVNKPLNNKDDAEKPNQGTNKKPGQDTASYGLSESASSDADLDERVDSTVETEGSATSEQEPASDEDDVNKETFTTDQRKRLADTGAALPDGSFPIRNTSDLRNAIHAYGRAGDKPRAKAHIIARAKALGASGSLPEGWSSGDGNVNKEGTVSEGAATVPVPIKKDDGTWDLSGVPESSRPFFEDVLGGRDEIAKQRDELRERLEKAETAVEEEKDKRLEREFVQKAEGFKHVAAPDELGPVLKSIADKITEEEFEILEKALAGAEERIAKSDLFKEVGRSGAAAAGEESPGDAWSQIEKAADELVEKDGELTKEAAIAKVLETTDGRELYKQYMAEV